MWNTYLFINGIKMHVAIEYIRMIRFIFYTNHINHMGCCNATTKPSNAISLVDDSNIDHVGSISLLKRESSDSVKHDVAAEIGKIQSKTWMIDQVIYNKKYCIIKPNYNPQFKSAMFFNWTDWSQNTHNQQQENNGQQLKPKPLPKILSKNEFNRLIYGFVRKIYQFFKRFQ